MSSFKKIFSTLVVMLIPPLIAAAQDQSLPIQAQVGGSGEDGIAVAPARFELPMLPGSEKTLVVNIIYNSSSGEAQPVRLVASLGDWSILKDGNVEYYKAGAQPNSACSWIIFSPGEVTAIPGKIHPLRVTISVPKDATPGDHLAALFVESRPDNIKLDQNRKQVVLRFRMAAMFYVMVPQLTKKGSLENLIASADERGVIVTPTLKNYGNSHIRPAHSIKVVDRKGAIVAETGETDSIPVLADCQVSQPLLIEKQLPPDLYSIQYRVDFKDGSPVVEGQTDLVIKDRLPAEQKNGIGKADH